MPLRFIHTADWQLGKRFGRVTDPAKQEALRAVRFQTVGLLAAAATAHHADFVLVAGDLFDSPTPTKDVVSRALAEIGKCPVPVLAIPGNHDHAGPGSVWAQPHFLEEQRRLAPQFRLLDRAEPVVLPQAIVFPCPLLRRHEAANPLAWIAAALTDSSLPLGLPRIVLAHGATQEFGTGREDEDDATAPNFLDLSVLPADGIDYIALGDWHGAKQVGPRAFYAGAIEADRFPKNEEYQSGQAVLVELDAPGAALKLTNVSLGGVGWSEIDHDFHGPDALAAFEARLEQQLGARVHKDCLRLHLTGSLSLEDDARLTGLLERYEARLLRCEVRSRPSLLPNTEEMQQLAARSGDPLIAAVATSLRNGAEAADPLELEALRQLFATLRAVETGRLAA